MDWTTGLGYFFGAAFLTNSAPHLICGVMGKSFQTPFARPRGVGHSTSVVNVVWGFFNLVIAWLLLCRSGNFDLHNTVHAITLGAGIFITAFLMALRFGQFNGGNNVTPDKH